MATINNPVGWFELYVSDMNRAKTFYEKVFNRPLSDLPIPGADYSMCTFAMDSQATGAAGALVLHPTMKPGTGGTLIYFSCMDCADEQQRVTQYGGLVHQPKHAIGEYGFIAIVGDSEGNTIGLHSMQ